MMIDDWGLTIDDWAPRGAVRRSRRASIVNRQSSIPPSLRRFVASSLLLLSSGIAFADLPRELIKQGNQQFDAGRYAEALEAYDQVGDEADELPTAELLHNRAAAHFKLGQLDEARELWVRAAGLRDEEFEAAARYNLGNCDYADALQAVQRQDAEVSLELLGRAIQQYRDALKLFFLFLSSKTKRRHSPASRINNSSRAARSRRHSQASRTSSRAVPRISSRPRTANRSSRNSRRSPTPSLRRNPSRRSSNRSQRPRKARSSSKSNRWCRSR